VDTLAKPYGSAWLGGQQAVMQDSTVAVQQLYEEGGFEISEDFRELPDHVAAELEFLYLLIFREIEAKRNGDLESTNAMMALRHRFLAEHLGAWIEPFAQAVNGGAQTPFYRELAELTRAFVGAEAAALRS
jgi:TorA maturation chaperone TorD